MKNHAVQNHRIENADYYSLYNLENIERAKVDSAYLGDLILANESLIWFSIHRYVGNPDVIVKNYSIDKDDILQLGRIGFIKSIKAFDTSRGVKFSSFAVIAIVREVRCFIRDSANILRPTRTAVELIRKIRCIEQELGYTPSVEDLSCLLDESEDKIVKALTVGHPIKYLEELQTEESPIESLIHEESFEHDVIHKVYLEELLDCIRDQFSDKEIRIFLLSLNDLSQSQIAEKENLSIMQVNRIIKKVAKTFASKMNCLP